ncbi:NAD(P)H-quinone oxidoreductase [Inhella crocodyli]|uniref:NAD(P)H-quinone oxidoreductase n=1 Tax=Inhella crocodyli TaxID=2499851 RepID=A0A437LUA9_9BURK|nr:NAD(P)H-quinone oxidoreductase [Inhella crocodyli]RVT88932.1 NAD(P)H-quinone oxidoreductase [Inhella crocodyli]
MLAVGIAQPGGPEVLALGEHPMPRAGAGECLIRVAASGVNRPDLLQRRGLYPPPAGASSLPGLEVAGIVHDGDAQALAEAGLAVGDRVCALVAGGGYAAWCVAPVLQCLPVPKSWSLLEAAAAPETFFTVWSNLFDQGGLKAGHRILVHGGASGIGTTAIQLAVAFGARVWVTVGSADKAAACLMLGAEGAFNYREQDFVSEGLAATQGEGFDLILDMVAGPYVARNQQVLAESGRLLVIAVQGGARAELDAAVLLRKRQSISGNTLRSRPEAFKAAIARQLRERVWPLVEVGRGIRPRVQRVLPAAEAAEAHRLLEEGAVVGKLVLDWEGA